MAAARAAPGPEGHIILCTGTGPVSVLVDADGQPTGATHLCPDCALSQLQALVATAADLSAPSGWIKARALALPRKFHSPAPGRAVARAPPRAA